MIYKCVILSTDSLLPCPQVTLSSSPQEIINILFYIIIYFTRFIVSNLKISFVYLIKTLIVIGVKINNSSIFSFQPIYLLYLVSIRSLLFTSEFIYTDCTLILYIIIMIFFMFLYFAAVLHDYKIRFGKLFFCNYKDYFKNNIFSLSNMK